MICKECGRNIKSLGVASHRAMHYRKRIAAQDTKDETMKYSLLSEGDTFKRGDEMQSPVTGIWSEVPYQWYGMKVSWSDNNTFSRFKISVRRASGVLRYG